MTDHLALMHRAVEISAAHMRANDGGPFGAVIARGARIIAEGHNAVTSTLDPTAHAEIVAIRAACRALGRFHLDGCVIYTSCEPCPMCLAAIYWARLDHVYYANTRADAQAIGFDDAMIYAEIARPITERAIPATRIETPAAAAVFAEWRAKDDKIPY